MKGLLFTKGLFLLIIMLAIALITGCAGSREQGSATDSEDFSSLNDTTGTERSTNGQSDEDEVLRLLGLSTSDETTTPAEESATGTQDMEDLEARIETLERNINEKNLQVANLKAELAERDRRIQDLKSEKSTTVTTYGSTPATSLASGSFKDRYNNALDLYYNRQYRQALNEFDALLAMSGSQNLKDNCQYWKGECYYGLNEFHQAIIEFEKVFVYSNSNKYDDSQLKLGLCYLKLGNREKARVEFQKLLDNYPDSEYVPKANQYLAGL